MQVPQRRIGTVAAAATVLVGWLLMLPLSTTAPLARWSFDVLQLVLPQSRHAEPDPVIIYMNEKAMQDYQQKSSETWPRDIHARLLDRLSLGRPRVVVFDVIMTQPSNPKADDELARAIWRNDRVVLAADRVEVTGQPGNTIVPILSQLETNARAWGIPKISPEPDQVSRRYDPGPDDQAPDLAWAAATVAGAPVTRTPERRRAEERWLNYYGAPRPFEGSSMTYRDAETMEPKFFKDRAVFIGGKPDTLLRGEITDVFRTPFTKWNSHNRFVPGVDITAIAYANLMRGDWLRRPGLFAELGLLLVTGAVVGFGLQQVRLRAAVWCSVLMGAVLAAGVLVAVLSFQVWFSWAIIGLAQLPCALLFRLLTQVTAVSAGAPAAARDPATVSTQVAASPSMPSALLQIPDHTLIRCIGEGAYGQVWVARNAIGLYHAVKVVFRNRFGTDVPFERGLRGIQKFMPVSRSHPGFIHILHVGRNEAGGFFFYIMEAGDDQKAGQQIDPATYAPKTLASELSQRGMIPAQECLGLMLALTEAVERLHQHQLIHRDIKPANIIFVGGHPKLADIDLVTDLSPQGEVSCIGTQGYMAPEGPGTGAADVFSLGRVLYVALTGKMPEQIPELPTRVMSQPDSGLFLALNQISCKACEMDRHARYASAALMRADLLAVTQRLGR